MVNKKEDVLFWLGVMRDHAIFQNSTLAPKEKSYIQRSMMFRDFFQSMMNRLKTQEDLNTAMPKIRQGLSDFISFKRNILKGLLTCKLEISLPPSFLNH